MDDLFAPPDGDWSRVSPALARLRRALLVTALLLVLAVLGIILLLALVPTWAVAVAAGVVVAFAAFGWVAVGRNASRWGYLERDQDLCITRGAWLRRLVVVPYGRMQYVDVQAGPIDRAFGIAQVRLHTASPGTTAYLPGLPANEAARLRDRLTSLGEAQAAGL
ncbi:PH domain-containing protein [soil metagenome]